MIKNYFYSIITLALLINIGLTSCTKKYPLPEVTTTEISEIQFETAMSGGEVLSDGGLEVIERGVCWGPSENPTTANSRTMDGAGLGKFSSEITGLQQGKNYYVRAYATTEAGTSYGETKSIGTPKRVYVLNSGLWGGNDATLTLTSPLTKNVFQDINKKKLGDLANHMITYGNKMYIAVNGSKVIFITDLNGKILKEIKYNPGVDFALSPREMDKGEGKVFVSFQEGYLGAIDTTTFEINSTKVGAFPEGVLYNDGKVFVANSDGMSTPPGETMSVVDASTLTVTNTLTVNSNPQRMILGNNGKIYLTTWGNFWDKPNTLQMIDPITYEVTSFEGVQATKTTLAKDGNVIILNSFYDEFWNQTVEYKVFDTNTNKIKGDFITDGTIILKGKEDGYSISTNPENDEVYLCATDYVSEGTIYVFSPDGKLLRTFESGGVNPMGVYFAD